MDNKIEIRYTYDNEYHDKICIFLGNQIHYNLIKSDKIDPKIKFNLVDDNLKNIILTTEDNLYEKYENINKNIIPSSEFDKDIINIKNLDNYYCPYRLSIYQNQDILFYFDDILMSVRIDIYDKQVIQKNFRVHQFFTTLIIKSNQYDKILNFILYVDNYTKNTNLNNFAGINLYKSINDEWISFGIIKPRNLDTIFMEKKKIQNIIIDIDNFLKITTEKLYNKLNIIYKRTYLLEGVPGTGKTSLIYTIASKYNYNICSLNFCKLDDNELQYLIKDLPNNSIFVIEDFDCIMQNRKEFDTSKNNITFPALLSMLDGILVKPKTLIFITTNHKKIFDPALLRPGRIDYVLTFDYSTQEQIGDIYQKYMSLDYNTGEISQNQEYLQEVIKNKKIFINSVMSLGIPITCSLLQQYLFKYFGQLNLLIKNIDEIKIFYNSLPNDNDHNNLYT